MDIKEIIIERTIVFVYDTGDEVRRKVNYIRGLIGENSIALSDRIDFEKAEELDFIPRYYTIRCTYEQFKEIEFNLKLESVYA